MTWPRRIAWLLVLAGLILFVAWGARLALLGRSLLEHVAQAQSLAEAPERADVEEICRLVGEVRGDVVGVRRQAGALAQLGPLLGWVPRIGGILQAAPHLLAVADGLSEAGAHLCTVAQAATNDQAAEDHALERYVNLLMEHQETVAQATSAVERAQAAWNQVDVERLSPGIAEKLTLLEEGLPLLHAGLVLMQEAPELLGFDGPRNYLILAQNEDELRPTGGFISGAGQLTMNRGEIAAISFLDTRYVDDYQHKSYPAPPEPLYTYMGSEIWLFRDANWSPDFPTSARQARYFYEYGQEVDIDGVIAVDQRALELLIAGLGEISVSADAEPVSAKNLRAFMRAAWNPEGAGATTEWIFGHKAFIGLLAEAIRQHIENNPQEIDWVQIAKSAHKAIVERHLLVWMDNAAFVNELARLGWDGALRRSTGDYWAVVDANLGFNKVNPLIEQTLAYRVVLHHDGTASAQLSSRYGHRGSRHGISCQHMFAYSGDLTYDTLMHACYYDYLRLYVPDGSVLRAATPHAVPGQYLVSERPTEGQAVQLADEAGKAVFAQFFVVEYGHTLTTTLEYDLPQVAQPGEDGWRYTLLVQKQAGTPGWPVTLTVVLPTGALLQEATPTPQTIQGGTLQFLLRLDADITVEVIYH